MLYKSVSDSVCMVGLSGPTRRCGAFCRGWGAEFLAAMFVAPSAVDRGSGNRTAWNLQQRLRDMVLTRTLPPYRGDDFVTG